MKTTFSIVNILLITVIPLLLVGQTTPEIPLKKLVNNPEANYGIIQVPMNHDDPSSIKIPLGYAIYPARNPNPGAPIILFTGGPGEFTIRNYHNYGQFPLVDDHDLILFDQRGTGYSHGLFNMSSDIFDILADDLSLMQEYEKVEDVVIAFRDSIQATGLELKYINTTQNAKDVGLLMKHLGYDQYIFMGGSYGTKIARRTMDLFPNQIYASLLAAPATWEDDFLTFRIKNYQRALGLIFNFCKNDPDCNNQYPNLPLDYVDAIRGLEGNPIEAEINDRSFIINPQDAMYMLRYQLYTPQAKSLAPAFINALKKRDVEAINNSQGFLKFVFDGVNFSMNMSIGRYEEYDANITKANIDEYYQDEAMFPSPLAFFNSFYLAAAKWHESEASKEEISFIPSSIPTLITVNKYDPVTPPENGYAYLKNLKKGQLLVLDEGGHSGGSTCQWEVMKEFLDSPLKMVKADCFNLIDRKNGW